MISRSRNSISVHPRVADVVKNLQLTLRQQTVVELVTLGWNMQNIASEMGIAESTVRSHLRATFERLDVASRTQLIALLMKKVVETASES